MLVRTQIIGLKYLNDLYEFVPYGSSIKHAFASRALSYVTLCYWMYGTEIVPLYGIGLTQSYTNPFSVGSQYSM